MNTRNATVKETPRGGFTLIEIMIVVAFIGLLAAISVPAAYFARTKAQTNSCVNNLRQIGSAVEQYAFDNLGATPTLTDLSPTYMREEPFCPAGGSYSLTVPPTCDVALHTL